LLNTVVQLIKLFIVFNYLRNYFFSLLMTNCQKGFWIRQGDSKKN